LGIAALSVVKRKTYFWAKYQRITVRRGPMRALVSVEHAMVVAAWHMLTSGEFYREPGLDYYTRRVPAKTKARAIRQLESLGYKVTLESLADTA
jgi:transposase